jgi:hypothetical protein
MSAAFSTGAGTTSIASDAAAAFAERRANRVGHVNEYNWDRAGLPVQCAGDLSGMCKQHIGPHVDQLFRERLRLRTSGRKTSLDVDITALRPSEPLELLSKFHDARLGFRIVLGQAHQHPDAPASEAEVCINIKKRFANRYPRETVGTLRRNLQYARDPSRNGTLASYRDRFAMEIRNWAIAQLGGSSSPDAGAFNPMAIDLAREYLESAWGRSATKK